MCCRDLNNKIKTTDRYIDQFLPFRMIKEVSQFLQFVLPDEENRKINILKKEKLKELYKQMFQQQEIVLFKDAMKKLSDEAERQTGLKFKIEKESMKDEVVETEKVPEKPAKKLST